MRNRIEYWRAKRGWSMQELADKASTTAPTVNKLEKGAMQLTVKWMERLAKALNVKPEDLLASNPKMGKEPDVDLVEHKYTERTDPALVPLSKLPNRVIYAVRTSVLDDIGIQPGDRILVDQSPERLKDIAPLSAVAVRYFMYSEEPKGKKPLLLLRQFLPPNKLVTNSSYYLAGFEINMDTESVEIVGVVEMIPRMLSTPQILAKRS